MSSANQIIQNRLQRNYPAFRNLRGIANLRILKDIITKCIIRVKSNSRESYIFLCET